MFSTKLTAASSCRIVAKDSYIIWLDNVMYSLLVAIIAMEKLHDEQECTFIGEVCVSSVYDVPCMYVRMFVIQDGMISWLACMYIWCYISKSFF